MTSTLLTLRYVRAFLVVCRCIDRRSFRGVGQSGWDDCFCEVLPNGRWWRRAFSRRYWGYSSL